MAKRLGFLENLLNRRVLSRWKAAADVAAEMPSNELRQRRGIGRQLKAQIDRLEYIAEDRLTLPRIGSDAFFRPRGTDWSWRPQLWRGRLADYAAPSAANRATVGDEVTLFHDCKISEVNLRQIRNTSEADLAPFGLRMDVFRFDGSFLSIVLDLPDEARIDLRMNHLIRVEAIVEMEYPLEIFARLNIKHGPNVEQIVREMPVNGNESVAEFDLAYTKLNEKRIEKVWLDLIFEGPEMNQVTLRDLTLCRYPRAQL